MRLIMLLLKNTKGVNIEQHPLFKLLNMMNNSAFRNFKNDIFNGTFKGFLHYLPGEDKMIEILDKIVLESDLMKGIKGFDANLIRDIFGVINCITNLELEKLIDMIVFSDPDIVDQATYDQEFEKKKKEIEQQRELEAQKKKGKEEEEEKPIRKVTYNLVERIYSMFGGNANDQGFLQFKRMFRIMITLASKNLRQFKTNP